MPKINFQAAIVGDVNGARIDAHGDGVIDEDVGLTVGLYRIGKLPQWFSPGLLTACILTGYPNATQTPAKLTNPFKGRSYAYRRTLVFGPDVALSYRATCGLDGDHLNSRFELHGRVPLVRLDGDFVQHIEETWLVGEDDSLGGRFDARWSCDGAQVAHAVATSAYDVAPGDLFTGAQRRLRLDAETRGDEFRLRQDSRLIA